MTDVGQKYSGDPVIQPGSEALDTNDTTPASVDTLKLTLGRYAAFLDRHENLICDNALKYVFYETSFLAENAAHIGILSNSIKEDHPLWPNLSGLQRKAVALHTNCETKLKEIEAVLERYEKVDEARRAVADLIHSGKTPSSILLSICSAKEEGLVYKGLRQVLPTSTAFLATCIEEQPRNNSPLKLKFSRLIGSLATSGAKSLLPALTQKQRKCAHLMVSLQELLAQTNLAAMSTQSQIELDIATARSAEIGNLMGSITFNPIDPDLDLDKLTARVEALKKDPNFSGKHRIAKAA